jgi:serine O-acetyltransferase
MAMQQWLDASIPDIVTRLGERIRKGIHIESDSGLNLTGRQTVYSLLDDILATLFPSVYSKEKVSDADLDSFLEDCLHHIGRELPRIAQEVLEYYCECDDCTGCRCDQKAHDACRHVLQRLPDLRAMLADDISVAYNSDPAARSTGEILLSYPGIEAIATYRIAHELYRCEIPIIPRLMTERAHSHTGIDIHPGAVIGSSFFIDHGTGVVIGETTSIGNNVKIYQGVTLGALSPLDKSGKARRGEKRHPRIEDDVIIYANATILGGRTTVGKGAIVSGNSWITSSVEPGSVAK